MPESFIYLNGQFLPRSQAHLDIEDRGTLFGDGVYEVTHYYAGRPLAMPGHLERLRRSLAGIELDPPAQVNDLPAISDELVRRNASPDAAVYWQVTRGPAPRRHVFPRNPRPTVLAITYPLDPIDPTAPVEEVAAVLAPDERWRLCSIKSLMLLPNVLAKNRAVRAGAAEAILHRDGQVTEGTSTNAFAVRAGELWTHPADASILGGITRSLLLELAGELAIPVHETAVTTGQLLAADEVFLTGTTTQIAAVTHVDGRPIGGGAAGPVTVRLYQAFIQRILRECGGR